MQLTLTLDTSDLARSDVTLLQAIASAVAPGFVPQTDTVVSVDGSTIVPAPAPAKAAPRKAPAKTAPVAAPPVAAPPVVATPEPTPVEEPAADDDDMEDVLGTAFEPTLKDAISRATALVSQSRMAEVKAALAKVGAKKVTEVPEDKVPALWALLPEPAPED